MVILFDFTAQFATWCNHGKIIYKGSGIDGATYQFSLHQISSDKTYSLLSNKRLWALIVFRKDFQVRRSYHLFKFEIFSLHVSY